MDEQTFKSKLFHAEVMSDVSGSPDYWAGYKRGLSRAYHGEQFGTEAEHELWSSLVDRDDDQSYERGRRYRDGLKVS